MVHKEGMSCAGQEFVKGCSGKFTVRTVQDAVTARKFSMPGGGTISYSLLN